jgi:hypothetical protein
MRDTDGLSTDEQRSVTRSLTTPGPMTRLLNTLRTCPPLQVLLLSEESWLGREKIETPTSSRLNHMRLEGSTEARSSQRGRVANEKALARQPASDMKGLSTTMNRSFSGALFGVG